MPLATMNVRKLIIENQVQAAFEAVAPRVSEQVRDNLHLLWAQFNFWEKQSSLGLGPPIEERNRILFALFSIISELEGNQTLLVMEVSLSKGYEQLTQLTKRGEIDNLLTWLMENYPVKFRERTAREAHNVSSPIGLTFTNAILQQYINEMGLGIDPGQLLNYLAEKVAVIPRFFLEWSVYSAKRREVVSAMEMKLEYEERKYFKHLLIMGILAGIGGATLTLFFTHTSDEINNLHEDGNGYEDGEPDDD